MNKTVMTDMKNGLKINFNYIKITHLNINGFKSCKLIIERLN